MYPPFDENLARTFCAQLIHNLDTYQCIDFEQDLHKRDPIFSTKHLFAQNAIGQMFGVLVCKRKTCTNAQLQQKICQDAINQVDDYIVLKAFSGQYNGKWLVAGWVPPLLDVNAYQKTIEHSDKEIHKLTDEIEEISLQISALENALQLDLHYKASTKDLQALKNLRKKRSALQTARKNLSRKSMQEIFALYSFTDARGNVQKFTGANGIFAQKQAPTGTGECCAPKLLNYAFSHQLQPLSLAEFYYGNDNNSHSKKHCIFYPPCDEKCAPLLTHFLGLSIIYRDEHIVVINKPSGLLSVPGRGDDKQDCVSTRLQRLYPTCIAQPSVHRLDMDTSGLMVYALTKESHRALSMQFMQGAVDKKYIALLDGAINDANGTIELCFRLDVDNRPHQIYDEVHGKKGITHWKKLSKEEIYTKLDAFSLSASAKKDMWERIVANTVTPVEFTPETGRTHQLRLHAMHAKGLNAAIVGDNLYGNASSGERLMLHASYLSFVHPVTCARMTFTSD